MKNIIKLSLLTILALPAMVGCANKGGSKEDLEKVAKTAAAEVGVAYSGYAGSDGLGLAGAKLITEYTVDETYNFKFEYSVAPINKAYEIEYLKVEEAKLVVEIPTFAELEAQGFSGATYAGYKLSAKIKYAGVAEGKKEQYASYKDKEVGEGSHWNIRINAETVKPVWQKISEARLKEKGETVVTTGYVTAFMNPVQDSEYSNGIWIADGADGMMLYGSSLTAYFGALHIGDMIMVIGPASPYNGLFEVNGPTIAFVDTTPEPIAQPVWTEVNEATLATYDAVKANDPVIIRDAIITSDVSETTVGTGAISLDVKVGNTTYTYYLNKHTSAEHRQAVIDKINANVGKAVTIKSILGYNSGKLQITGCVITDNGGIADCLTFAD